MTATAEAPPATGEVPPRQARSGASRTWRRGTRGQRIGALVVILGALGFLLFRGLTNATQYFYTADQAVAQRAHLGTKDFRIEGTVLANPGVSEVGQTVRFSIGANSVTVPVVSTTSPPSLFKVGIPVVLEGHWQGSTFLSDLIMVKHSASYTEAHPERLKPQKGAPAK